MKIFELYHLLNLILFDCLYRYHITLFDCLMEVIVLCLLVIRLGLCFRLSLHGEIVNLEILYHGDLHHTFLIFYLKIDFDLYLH